MRYSLSSRFRGTLIGTALAESFNNKQQRQLDVWYRMAVVVAKSLILCGELDLEDLKVAFAKDTIISNWHESFAQDGMNRGSTKAIIATLPITLFYHDNEIKLRQNLLSFVDIWQQDAVVRDGTLAVGYAIAQSLGEKLDAANLIEQIIVFLGKTNTQLPQQLSQVQTLLEKKAGLERVVTELSRDADPSTPIALAFYYFLSTLEDWRLSVVRATQKNYQRQIVGAQDLTPVLTGALSGAYNSTVGIPATQRMLLSRLENEVLVAWGITTEAEILEIADSLVAVWSGVYDSGTYPTELIAVNAIAAPRVIRLR